LNTIDIGEPWVTGQSTHRISAARVARPHPIHIFAIHERGAVIITASTVFVRNVSTTHGVHKALINTPITIIIEPITALSWKLTRAEVTAFTC
jgi:hypothetical protein